MCSGFNTSPVYRQKIRKKGFGMPKVNLPFIIFWCECSFEQDGTFGDLFVQYEMVYPSKLEISLAEEGTLRKLLSNFTAQTKPKFVKEPAEKKSYSFFGW